METLFAILLVVAILAFVVWVSIVVPYQMSRKRDRSAAAWILVSILVSPIVAIVVLHAMGPAVSTKDLTDTFA